MVEDGDGEDDKVSFCSFFFSFKIMSMRMRKRVCVREREGGEKVALRCLEDVF